MTVPDIISDIQKLVGLELHSIRPGSDITIQSVDLEKDCLILILKDGKLRSRPLSEIRAISNEMFKSPAVHVDGVLHGSGTSRNQPETILANLPYVEWLKVNNKKHIAYVGKSTHPFGTLKKMDAIQAAALSDSIIPSSPTNKVRLISVTDDISRIISKLRETIAGTVVALEAGVYIFQNDSIEITIFTTSKASIPAGCYLLLDIPINPAAPSVVLNHKKYHIIRADNFAALVEIH